MYEGPSFSITASRDHVRIIPMAGIVISLSSVQLRNHAVSIKDRAIYQLSKTGFA